MTFSLDRRRYLQGLAGVTGTLASTGLVAGRGRCDVLVDQGGGGDATTVQGGVDAADPGDTVCVADGTYVEHVHVDKDLTLTNAAGAAPTIALPPDPPNYEIPESSGNWETVVFVGNESGTNVVDVDVSGLQIDGGDQQPTGPASRLAGVLLRNVRGRFEDNRIANMAVGVHQTGGLAIYAGSDVTVTGNNVDGYERFGIVANGDGGAHPSPNARIARNRVVGSTGIGEAWAPNGIQLGFGATGAIGANRVSDNRYSDVAQVASGIIVFETDGVTVRGNTVDNSDAALTCGTWGWFRQTANGNRFVRNDVAGAIVGAHLEAVAWDGVSAADPTLSETKIVNNDLDHDATGDPSATSVGVELLAFDDSSSFDPVISGTKVIRNEISGFDEAVVDGGTGTKARANVVEP